MSKTKRWRGLAENAAILDCTSYTGNKWTYIVGSVTPT